MLADADDDAGFEKYFDDVIVIASLSALVLCFNHYAGDIVGPLIMFGTDVRACANVTRSLRKWGSHVDRKSHLATEHEARWRVASRF